MIPANISGINTKTLSNSQNTKIIAIPIINDITWIFLYGQSELIKERMAARKGHYFKSELLDSQFADLEPPQYGWHFNISSSSDHIVKSILNMLRHTD